MSVERRQLADDILLLVGDVRDSLKLLPDESVQCVTTSPPYWSLRDYGTATWEGGDPECEHRKIVDGVKAVATSTLGGGKKTTGHQQEGYKQTCPRCGANRIDSQLGLEPTPELYVANMVAVFREVRRVLRKDGTCWINLGDSYCGSGVNDGTTNPGLSKAAARSDVATKRPSAKLEGIKPKNLIGIPWRTAFALQADGWWLRSDIIWCLSGGTKVYAKTQKGEMPTTIKDLVRLDPATVKLWNGQKWTQVLGWSETPRPDETYEIELRSGERIGCTAEHQWPTRRGNVRVDQLQVGDVIQTCRLPEPEDLKRPDGLDDDLVGWFVGLYLAEGSRDSTGTIQISGHVKENERYKRLQEVAESYHGTCRVHTTKGNGATICMDGPILNAILDTYVAGHDAKDKHPNVRCWQRSDIFLFAILRGYLAGDGHYDSENERYRLGFTSNDNLAADLRTICARLDISLRLKRVKHTMNGREFPGYRGQIRMVVSDHRNNKPDGEVVTIRRSRARKFWDIGVQDEPHLFSLASGVLTHNSKPNPMPESVTDRPTKAHEYIFLLTKSPAYCYDHEAIAEAACQPLGKPARVAQHKQAALGRENGGTLGANYGKATRNKRTVWTVATHSFPEDHFATYPPKLIEPCILAGTSPQACPKCGAPWERVVVKIPVDSPSSYNGSTFTKGKTAAIKPNVGQKQRYEAASTDNWQPACTCEGNDGTGKCVVLDPFNGSGTTGLVALENGRSYIGCELNPDYAAMTARRLLKGQRKLAF